MASTDESEAFVRWQGLTITQLGQTTSVMLGLAVAALGFDVTLLMNREFVPISWQRCAFASGILVFLGSIALGLWCSINRLRDFRLTMWAARDRERDAAGASAKRTLANQIGRKTWRLFWAQIGTFSVGVILTVAVVAGVYGHKLL